MRRPQKSFKVGQTVSPSISTWYKQKYNWTAALIYDIRTDKLAGEDVYVLRLKGVAGGVEFDFEEYADYLKLKE